MQAPPEYTFYNLEEHPLPHLGVLLNQFMEARRTRKSSLSIILGINPSGITRFIKKPSLQCQVLWRFSYALNHNFFQDLAAQLPPTFTTNAPDPTLPLQERIAALEEENKLLNAKLETLKEVMRKG